MVTLGDEGMGLPGDTSYPYQYGEGTDWVGLLNITTLYVAPLECGLRGGVCDADD